MKFLSYIIEFEKGYPRNKPSKEEGCDKALIEVGFHYGKRLCWNKIYIRIFGVISHYYGI